MNADEEWPCSLALFPDTAPIPVTAAYNVAGQYWRLSPSDSQRLVFVYKLSWLPTSVQLACETAQASGQAVTVALSPSEYQWIFRAKPVGPAAVQAVPMGQTDGFAARGLGLAGLCWGSDKTFSFRRPLHVHALLFASPL